MNTVKSKVKYNDGAWHSLKASRAGLISLLEMNGEEVGSNSGKGGASNVNNLSKFYFGGLPDSYYGLSKLPKGVGNFNGGIATIKLNGNVMSGEVSDGKRSPAFERLLEGITIGRSGGHAVMRSKFGVGKKIKFELNIRPTTRDGYVLYNGGKGNDFVAIKLKAGNVVAECNNGGGVFSAVVEPKRDICDGTSHNIIFYKDGQLLVLKVDGKMGKVETDKPGSSAETGGPLKLGAGPDPEAGKYTGCINQLKIWGKAEDLNKIVETSGSVAYGCGGSPSP